MSCSSRRSANREGFTLIEVLVAMLAALIVLASVFALLTGSQDSFRRENEVADTQMSTRAGMVYLTRDLSTASYRTPPMAAILWNDGGGINPDEVFEGKVTSVVRAVDVATRTFVVEAEIANRDERLKPGLFARVELDLKAVPAS